MMVARNSSGDAFVRLHLSILLAGCTGLFGGFVTLSQLPMVWYRVMIGAVVLTAFLALTRQLRVPPLRSLLKIVGCGLLLTVHWVFFYGSIKEANVSIGVVCFAMVGLFTSILEPLIFRHGMKWRELLLSLVTVAGILLIFGLDARYRYGIVLGMISSLLYSLFSIFSKRVSQSSGATSGVMLLFELWGGFALLSLLIPFFLRMSPEASVALAGDDWWLMLVFGSVFTVLPFLLQLQALRRISAFTVNLSYNLEPIYSIVLANVFFSEATEMGLSFWIGVGLILTSVILQTFFAWKAR